MGQHVQVDVRLLGKRNVGLKKKQKHTVPHVHAKMRELGLPETTSLASFHRRFSSGILHFTCKTVSPNIPQSSPRNLQDTLPNPLLVCSSRPCISARACRSGSIDRPLPRLMPRVAVPTALSVLESANAPRRGRKHHGRREPHANQWPRRPLEVAPGQARRNLNSTGGGGGGGWLRRESQHGKGRTACNR